MRKGRKKEERTKEGDSEEVKKKEREKKDGTLRGREMDR